MTEIVAIATATASWLMALAAVIAVIVQGVQHRRSVGLELALKFRADFTTDRMFAKRRSAAAFFTGGESKTQYSSAADEIINFYEDVGYYVSRKMLDKVTAWNFFSSHLLLFWHFSADYVARIRAGDPGVWEYVGRLHDDLQSIERSKRRGSDISGYPTAEQCREFIENETHAG